MKPIASASRRRDRDKHPSLPRRALVRTAHLYQHHATSSTLVPQTSCPVVLRRSKVAVLVFAARDLVPTALSSLQTRRFVMAYAAQNPFALLGGKPSPSLPAPVLTALVVQFHHHPSNPHYPPSLASSLLLRASPLRPPPSSTILLVLRRRRHPRRRSQGESSARRCCCPQGGRQAPHVRGPCPPQGPWNRRQH